MSGNAISPSFTASQGTIEAPIGRHPVERKRMTVRGDGRPATTRYRTLFTAAGLTLIELELLTGRTHQIRVHMKHIGHPLFNDEIYGGDRIVKGTVFSKYKQFVDNCFELCPRHALHAKTIGFIHPRTRKPVHFDSEIPADMQAVITKWRTYVRPKNME